MMSDNIKQVILRFSQGDLQSGFSVNLQIRSQDQVRLETDGFLPANPTLLYAYQQLRDRYRQQFFANYRGFRTLRPLNEVTHISIQDAATDLTTQLNLWLDQSASFQPIRDDLLHQLDPNDTVRFVIRTANAMLQWFPWHLCNLFQRYHFGGVSLCLPQRSHCSPLLNNKSQVKVLPILGDDTGIDIQADLLLLQDKLPPDAQILEPLVGVSRSNLGDVLWQAEADILFFAGHSSSTNLKGVGEFYLNEQDSVTIEDLKYALQRAIKKGLKLAIFNSCDGLKLAQDLADLNLPATIVMRERISDAAAQRFLEYFLEAFTDSQVLKPLSLAVREAQERLHALEQDYPCASWLPVLCQQTEAPDLYWQDLREDAVEQLNPESSIPSPLTNNFIPARKSSLIRQVLTIVCTSLVATALSMGSRSLGWLESGELFVYDLWMKQRHWFIDESPDEHILLVENTTAYIETKSPKERNNASITPEDFAKAITILNNNGAAIIGSLIQREGGLDDSQFTQLMVNTPNLVMPCRFVSETHSGVTLPSQRLDAEQQGFDNFIYDVDGVLRRDLIQIGQLVEPCQTKYSLSWQLANRYIDEQLQTSENLLLKNKQNIGQALTKNDSGYHNIDSRGFQILVNYRSSDEIATKVTLSELLSGTVPQHYIRDRIVLIGTTDPSFGKTVRLPIQSALNSPYSSALDFYAQSTSQLIQAALYGRALIRGISTHWLFLWTFTWSILAASIIHFLTLPSHRYLALFIVLILLYCSGLSFLILGAWFTFLSPLVGASLSIAFAMMLKKQTLASSLTYSKNPSLSQH